MSDQKEGQEAGGDPSVRRGDTNTYVMVDVEADGPCPGDYSMVAIGAVVVDRRLDRTFKACLKPVSDKWIKRCLDICRLSRAQTLAFEDPKDVMERFAAWLAENAPWRPRMISDNNGYDWQYVNWYFHHFTGSNPFGHSSANLGSFHKGVVRDCSKSFKHLRRTRHTHDPLDDAMGNAEALVSIVDEFGVRGVIPGGVVEGGGRESDETH